MSLISAGSISLDSTFKKFLLRLRAFSPLRDFLLRYTFPTQFRQILILLRALSSMCFIKAIQAQRNHLPSPGSLRPSASGSQTEVSAPVKLKSEAVAGPIPAWCNGYLIRVLGGRGHTAPPPLPPFTSPSRFLCNTSCTVMYYLIFLYSALNGCIV
jgi:hypothetical protein